MIKCVNECAVSEDSLVTLTHAGYTDITVKGSKNRADGLENG